MAKQFPESLLEFEHWFRTDDACRDYLFKLRWPDGFHCPRCQGRCAWRSRRNLFHCASCRRDVSVTSATVFHRSHLPLRTWFRIVWWATNQKSGLSALGLQRMLNLGSYETAWTSLQKLRRAMVRLGREALMGSVEVDEAFLGGVRREKAVVAVAAEIRGQAIGRIRLQRISDKSGRSIIPFVRDSVASGSTIVTDGWAPYGDLAKHGFRHDPLVLAGRGREASSIALPRVHRVVSLMKRWMLGMHQGRIELKKLDPYLDEFAFRFNRRTSPSRGQLFYRLLSQCVVHGPTTYNEIIQWPVDSRG